jgi:phasin family protein
MFAAPQHRPRVEDKSMAAKLPEQFFDFDISKYLADFKVPGVDVETIVASQRKNIEALTLANKLAYEGLQNVVKRQVEILRQTIDEVAQVGKDFAEPGSPQDKAAKQADFAKDAFERALGNARELAEIVTKANSEAFELLNKRFTQSLEEARDTFVQVAGKK